MFCVITRNEREKSIIFESYAEMREYVKRVYKPTRLKDKGYYKLESIGVKHLGELHTDAISAFKDTFECVCYDKLAQKELKRTFRNATRDKSVWRLEIYRIPESKERGA